MNLNPYYRDRSPSKEIQDHFKENGGIDAYFDWQDRMDELAEKIKQFMEIMKKRHQKVSNVVAHVLANQPIENRNKVIEACKTAFAYLAPLTNKVDGRNKNAYEYFILVSKDDFVPESSFDDAKKVAVLAADKGLAEEYEPTLKTIFDELAKHSSQEIAECFIGEIAVEHATHQQSIIYTLHGAFLQLHLAADTDSDDTFGWALKAGRTNTHFPYI